MASRQNSSQMLNSSQSSSSNSTNPVSTKSGHKSEGKNNKDKSSSGSSSSATAASSNAINSMNNMSKQQQQQQRKGTSSSFQITSVFVNSGQNQAQQQLNQQNNGDDSADDLDESHTDDNMSRITDYETPSFSEDTFSREEVYFGQPNAFDAYQVPVIPTSSQYGLAIVGPDLGGNGSNLSDVHVSVTDAGINIMGQIPNKQDPDHKNERFKVVKIESTEPFKRGRWICMDYLDHTTLQAQDDGTDGSPNEDAVGSNLDNGDVGDHLSDNDGCDQEVLRAETQNHHHRPQIHHASHHHQAQTMPQGHLEHIISNSMNASETTTSGNPDVQHAQSMTPDVIQRSLDQHQQGVTLPTNILMQNIGLDQHHHQQQQQSHNASDDADIQHQQQQDAVTSQFQQTTGDKQSIESEGGGVGTTGAATNDNIISNSSVSDNNNFDSAQNTSSPSSSAGLGTAAEGASASEVNTTTNTTTPAATGGDDGQSLNEDSESASGTSAVAIDNKIEQAMDLVKSHLMFAVREEVEVLKEKIAELMDRINQLEVENTILKANASQETLSQLPMQATMIVSPQTQVQTSPAQQPQSSPALSKINIDVLQASANVAPSQPQPQQQQQPPTTQPPAQNPPPQQNSSTTS